MFPYSVVRAYAANLADNNCTAWANLFEPNGCKIDSPAPACGFFALVKFCSANPFVGGLAYSLRGNTLVSRVEDTFQVLAGFLLAGRTSSGVIAQDGFNSFVINATSGLIISCTGYLEQAASTP